jgi:predicted nucleic acid-binding protein
VTVFADTSALLALLDVDDEGHARALAAWASLAEAEAPLVTTNFVVLETIAVVQRRLGLDAVRAFVRDVMPLVDVVFIDEGLQQAALSALLAAGRRRLSLVDCASFEVMRRRQIGRAFAYDAHFEEQGFDGVG